MTDLAVMTAISLGVAAIGWILSLSWYRATRSDELDRDTILFFAKLWLGVGALGILLFFVFKFK
jgi:hypothetical protein